jgi:type VI secretion system FHA domain protein
MRLVLTTTRCPAGVAASQREVTGDELAIGRSVACDWVLPDPDKILSKRHCLIVSRGESWLVTDTSANGTLLNGAALESELPHALRDSDRLTVGKYEIEARIGGARSGRPDDAPTRFAFRSDGSDDERLTSDPFAAPDKGALEAARPPIGLPLNFDALTADDELAETAVPAADHTPDLHAHFRAPRPSLDMLPEDWDAEDETPAPAPETFSADAPCATPAETVPVSRPDTPHPSSAEDRDAFAAFLAGAGIAGDPPADAQKAFEILGAAFRAMVTGLRQSMIARATVKGEFRIGQTMIQAAGNNPLKFSADDDDALAAMLSIGRQGVMSPETAVSEALRDIRLHELATAAALQSAIRSLLAEFAPETIMAGIRETAIDDLLGRRKQVAWDAYAARHDAVLRALSDEFDSVFGRSFARAYEAALSSISAQERE